jgi:peptidyl-dipeptidase Dcp
MAPDPMTANAPSHAGGEADANPLLDEWRGPYGGVPPFDRVRVHHFAPALEAAMAANLAEVERIAAQSSLPTFHNTLAALETAGLPLERVRAVYRVWGSALSTPEFQAVERQMAPRLAAFADRITQNAALFRRIEAVYEAREAAGLTREEQRLAWLYHTTFVRAGARLDDAQKARVAAINERMAELFTRFAQNVLADETDRFLVVRDEADLSGVPRSARKAAADAAAARGMDGVWVIPNTRYAVQPVLEFGDHRGLRERAWRMFTTRGESEGERDNRPVAAEILRLRAERATLLGYPTHAHWRLEHTMAAEPERALELLESVWEPAVAAVRAQVAELRALAGDALGPDGVLQPWDYRYYAEKLRKQQHHVDEADLEPYLRLDGLRDGMFWAAERLFGVRFTAAPAVPVYHPDVHVWSVDAVEGGRHVGLFYFDPLARTGKRSGAWMDEIRRQAGDVTPLVTNCCNYVGEAGGGPVRIAWGDARVLFHEFGHALHGLLSRVGYPSLSGTSVPRDYVEFPSQLMENWLPLREVLQRFAIHAETGVPIPHEMVERVEAASRFHQGRDTVEYLASAIVDMKLHLAAPDAEPPHAFEARVLEEIGMPREVATRHRTPHFQHVFAGDDYSAGYYSYLWADVLSTDAFDAFREADGPFDPEVARRVEEHVLSAGNTVDPGEAYRVFRGRDPRIGALMRKRGFDRVEQPA